MRKRWWLVMGVVLFCGVCPVVGHRAAQRFGWIACYTIPELERFPETQFLPPESTVLNYRTINGPSSVGYPWFDSLHWELGSPHDAETVRNAYRAYLQTHGWTGGEVWNGQSSHISWGKGRLRLDLRILSPSDVQVFATDGLPPAQTWYAIMLMESDHAGACRPSVPSIAD